MLFRHYIHTIYYISLVCSGLYAILEINIVKGR